MLSFVVKGGKQNPINYPHVRTACTSIAKEQTWKNAFRISIMQEVTKGLRCTG